MPIDLQKKNIILSQNTPFNWTPCTKQVHMYYLYTLEWVLQDIFWYNSSQMTAFEFWQNVRYSSNICYDLKSNIWDGVGLKVVRGRWPKQNFFYSMVDRFCIAVFFSKTILFSLFLSSSWSSLSYPLFSAFSSFFMLRSYSAKSSAGRAAVVSQRRK